MIDNETLMVAKALFEIALKACALALFGMVAGVVWFAWESRRAGTRNRGGFHPLRTVLAWYRSRGVAKYPANLLARFWPSVCPSCGYRCLSSECEGGVMRENRTYTDLCCSKCGAMVGEDFNVEAVPEEERPSAWCENCKSYHIEPQTREEWRTLMCFAPYKGERSVFGRANR